MLLMLYFRTVRLMICILLSFLLLILNGCATHVTGPYQTIPVTSDPSGITVIADTGKMIITPGNFSMKRNKDHWLEVYDGNEMQRVVIKHRPQLWFFANAIAGGAVGGICDISNGSSDELYPARVHIIMKPLNTSR